MNLYGRGIFVALTALALTSTGATVQYVDAQTGSDATGDGSAGKPFATLEKARQALRDLKKQHAFPPDGATVECAGIFAYPQKTFELSTEDSGRSEAARVTYRAAKRGARFVGGYTLPPGGFKKLTDAATRARLPEAVRDRVVVFDLKTVGVPELKPLPVQFQDWKEIELFSGDRALNLARWPNQGWTSFAKVIDRGVKPVDHAAGEWENGVRGGTFAYAEDVPARWNIEKGVWINAFWCWDWANESIRIAKLDPAAKQITLAGIHTYGVGSPWEKGKSNRRWYAFNLLEELDKPGEWYIDRENRLLYLYPVDNRVDDIFMSFQKSPIIRVREAKFVTLEGLQLGYSIGTALAVEQSSHIVLNNLQVCYTAGTGITVSGGTNCVLARAHIFQTGAVGAVIAGGDRKSLTPCGHRVEACDFHNSGRLSRMSAALSYYGVGITVRHNRFHDTPYIAVTFGGNDHVFEHNEVSCAMMESGDGGGLYTGRDWGSQGNVIRYNHFHDFGADGAAWRAARNLPLEYEPLKNGVMVMGVYLDDCDSGDAVYGNLFERAGWAGFVGGGRYNTFSNNVFIACAAAFHLDVRGLQRARPGEGTQDGWDLLKKLQDLNYQASPWKDRYPWLVNIMEDEPKLPLHNAFVDNVAIDCPLFLMAGSEVDGVLPRVEFRGNLVYGPVTPKDAARFPQTADGQKRVRFCGN